MNLRMNIYISIDPLGYCIICYFFIAICYEMNSWEIVYWIKFLENPEILKTDAFHSILDIIIVNYHMVLKKRIGNADHFIGICGTRFADHKSSEHCTDVLDRWFMRLKWKKMHNDPHSRSAFLEPNTFIVEHSTYLFYLFKGTVRQNGDLSQELNTFQAWESFFFNWTT